MSEPVKGALLDEKRKPGLLALVSAGLFILLCAVLGAVLAEALFMAGLVVGVLAGVLASGVLLVLARELGKQEPAPVLGGVVGLVLGLLLSFLLVALFSDVVPAGARPLAAAFLGVLFTYPAVFLGVQAGNRYCDPPPAGAKGPEGSPHARPKILDTSVIIDGRVADVCEAGFVEGPLVLPRFVLKELQQIADSPDALRRKRGRRGLDVLQRIRENEELDIQIVDSDFPRVKDVDAKLVLLGKEMSGLVMTNDFNLNKVAELEGVRVLNINELANAVKPVVLPGEEMAVFVIKEGKEHNQGVGYLNDGTMVVVDHAKHRIGETVSVFVTSVLQTTAGRMIFAKIRDEAEPAREGASREGA